MADKSRWDDMVNMAENPAKIPQAVADARAASALEKLDRLETTVAGLTPPFQYFDRDLAFSELDLENFVVESTAMSNVATAVAVVDKQAVIQAIRSNNKTPLPVGVRHDNGVLLYTGVELATARKLLGDASLVVKRPA